MKVAIINGSPHARGNTYDMLMDIANELEKEGIEYKLFWIGTQAIHGCIACGKCDKTHRCIFDNDIVNEVIDYMHEADGFIVGSPVYYASPNGALICALDRIFYAGNREFSMKPAASCVVARRAGTTSSLEVLNKYFTITEMPIISSVYWPMEFGRSSGETRADEEGVYVMRRLGKNFAYALKAFRMADNHGLEPTPLNTDRPWTHFIR